MQKSKAEIEEGMYNRSEISTLKKGKSGKFSV